MWFIGVEVEQETSAPPPKKNPGSAPGEHWYTSFNKHSSYLTSTAGVRDSRTVVVYPLIIHFLVKAGVQDCRSTHFIHLD